MTDIGVPTLLDTVLAAITDDAPLAALFVGGIYDRPLMQAGPDVYGSTPDAFSATNVAQVRPSMVIRNQPRTPINRFAERHIFECWMYVPATADGKRILARGGEMLRILLNGWNYGTWSGTGGVVSWIGQTGYRDDPVYTGSLVDVVRFQATALLEVPS